MNVIKLFNYLFQFYKFIKIDLYYLYLLVKSINRAKKEELINKCVSYVNGCYRLCKDHLIKVNTERQKTNSFHFIFQIDDTFNSVAKVIERLDQFRNLEELIFVLINIEVSLKLKKVLILFNRVILFVSVDEQQNESNRKFNKQ